jgi:putative tricarboxylic transport membrane protein
MRSNDLYSSIALCLTGLAFLCGGLRLGFGSLSTPGPGFMPIIVGAALSSLSIILVALTLIAGPSQERVTFWQEKTSWRKVLSGLLSLILYLLFLNPMGYLITTSLFLIYLLRFVGKRRWSSSVLVGLLACVASYFVFKVVLEVRLPAGMIPID